MNLPKDLKLKLIREFVEANKLGPEGEPMLANNISPLNASLILERSQ